MRSSRHHGSTRRRGAAALLFACAALSVVVGSTLGGCTDPVRDAEIEALGPEEPGVTPNPEHRPGQPCLHCHSQGGPASNKPFAIAGTVYETDQPGSNGADGIFVQFVDSAGGGPREIPQTGPSGNFYVPLQDWPDLKYPVRVGLYEDLNGPPTVIMKSLINREGSCNFCHRPNLADPTDEEIDDSRSSAGQIFLRSGS
ncbi:MAG: hypothetical protein KIS78_17735 [Labilithrix sp.]|nr:hypothetical protein [Labilithrix sp.]